MMMTKKKVDSAVYYFFWGAVMSEAAFAIGVLADITLPASSFLTAV